MFFVVGHLATAKTEYAHFVHFGTNEGMVSDKVLNIEQDPKGHLWIATDFGIDRFNGSTFKHYQGDGYPELKQEFIHAIKYIGNGKLEACGQFGFLQEYDMKTDSFTSIISGTCEKEKFSSILKTYMAPDSTRYAMTNTTGLLKYDRQKRKYVNISKGIKELETAFIGALYIDPHGRYWVGSLGKVFIFSKDWKLLGVYASPSKKGGAVTNLYPLGNSEIAATSYSDEIWIFDTQKEDIGTPRIISLPFNNAAGLLLDKTGKLWIASDGDGLWYTTNIGDKTPTFNKVVPFNAENNEIEKIYAMTEDSKGNLWIGTYNCGIWGYMKQQSDLVYFSQQKGFPPAVCTGFLNDKEGNLWVSTDGNGLYKVSPGFQQISHYNLPCKNLLSIERHNNNMLIPTWGMGLLSFNPANQQTQRVAFGEIGKGIDYIGKAQTDSSGMVWISTSGDGIYQKIGNQWKRFLLENNNPEKSEKWPKKLVQGKNGDQWIVTSNSLWLLKDGKAQDLLVNYTPKAPHHSIFLNDAIELPNGDLLVAAQLGILYADARAKEVRDLDFMPDYACEILLKDDKERIWAATTEGVFTLDVNKKTYKRMVGDHLSNQRYNFFTQAGYKGNDGKLYFGTSSGFFCYNIEGDYAPCPIAHMSFADLYINNAKVKPHTGVLKDGHISNLKSIELAYDQTNINIEIDLVDFEELNNAKLRYRLIGLNDSWIDLYKGKNIMFNHLPKGDYILEVEAQRANSVSEKAKISIELSVLPPWWSTWWFRLAVLLTIGGLTVYTIRQRYIRMKETQQLLAQTVDERTRDLKNALSEKNRLISVVAHDLKNPMFAIVSSLGSWISKNRGFTNNEAQLKPIEEIYNSSSVLQNEMQKLLDWVQSDSISTTWNLQPTNLSELLQDVISMLKKQVDMKGLTIVKELELRKCALVDAKSMEIVIRNLISNSIKFTPRGGNIVIKTIETAGSALLEISDNGIGMDKATVKKLSAAGLHESTEGTDKEKGTGLGISLCQTYIKRNKGSMHINSKPGVGTSFSIMLPLTEVVADPQIETQHPDEDTKDLLSDFDGSILEGNTLLIIDDDELIRKTQSEIIGAYATVITAQNGEEGLAIATKQQPDIIISDVSMPVMDGLEMGRLMAQQKETQHIPLLFISANNEEQDRIDGLKSGAVDYITKPFSSVELLFKLSNMLSLRQHIQQNLLNRLMEEKAKTEEEKAATAAANEEMAPDLKKFIDLLEKNYTNCDLQIDDLAKEMYVSQSTMSRRIKALSGKTPVELLSQYRLNKAKALLTECKEKGQDMPIAEIALQVGFTDPSYFTRRFKDYFGFTPSQLPEA